MVEPAVSAIGCNDFEFPDVGYGTCEPYTVNAGASGEAFFFGGIVTFSPILHAGYQVIYNHDGNEAGAFHLQLSTEILEGCIGNCQKSTLELSTRNNEGWTDTVFAKEFDIGVEYEISIYYNVHEKRTILFIDGVQEQEVIFASTPTIVDWSLPGHFGCWVDPEGKVLRSSSGAWVVVG